MTSICSSVNSEKSSYFFFVERVGIGGLSAHARENVSLIDCLFAVMKIWRTRPHSWLWGEMGIKGEQCVKGRQRRGNRGGRKKIEMPWPAGMQ